MAEKEELTFCSDAWSQTCQQMFSGTYRRMWRLCFITESYLLSLSSRLPSFFLMSWTIFWSCLKTQHRKSASDLNRLLTVLVWLFLIVFEFSVNAVDVNVVQRNVSGCEDAQHSWRKQEKYDLTGSFQWQEQPVYSMPPCFCLTSGF